MTPYGKHKRRWDQCKNKDCPAYKGVTITRTMPDGEKQKRVFRRQKVVHVRGTLPAPLLFIGEAPAASEDVLGKPFVGPAGKLFDHLLDVAVDGRCDYALANLVGCISYTEEGNRKKKPDELCVLACKDRVLEIFDFCKPQAVFLLGRAREWATDWFSHESSVIVKEMLHPGEILVLSISQRALGMRRCVDTIESVLERLS